MKTRVRLFAILREKVGTSEVTLELPERSTVANLMKEMAHRYPALLEGVAHTMVAVNTEYAQEAQLLHEGDEVAIIPPVSGGAPYYPNRSAPQPNTVRPKPVEGLAYRRWEVERDPAHPAAPGH